MLELKQTQKLLPVLTQQLQQAIKMLQLSQIELLEAIEQELQENPVLEVKDKDPVEESGGESTAESGEEPGESKEEMEGILERFTPSEDFSPREDKDYPDYENMVSKTYGLRDYLRWQIGLSDFDPQERIVAEWIIGNIDDNGYLAYPLEEIVKVSGYTMELLESALRKVQKLDPPGIGARDLKECILIQHEAAGVKDAVFEEVVGRYFELIEKNNLKEIVRKTGYSMDQIKEVLDKIKHYDPKPGRNFSDDSTSYVTPDVYVVREEDGFEVFLNDDDVPELRMNKYYLELYVGRKVTGEAKRYIKNKIKQAEWFIKSIRQRQKTLYLVAKSIVAFQGDFLEQGIRSLKPLILKDVAQDIGVHESTVSRVTTNKYMSTPFGVFEMKFFFPTGISMDEGPDMSTNVVMDLITEITRKEDKGNPVTDDDIVVVLKNDHGIRIARRTVAKYREILNIGSSRQRKSPD